MSTGSGIRLEIPYLPEALDGVSAELGRIGPAVSGGVNIELWDVNGVSIDPASSGCNRMGDTDFYTWPISGLSTSSNARRLMHWRMSSPSGSSDTPQGDIVIFSVYGGHRPGS